MKKRTDFIRSQLSDEIILDITILRYYCKLRYFELTRRIADKYPYLKIQINPQQIELESLALMLAYIEYCSDEYG